MTTDKDKGRRKRKGVRPGPEEYIRMSEKEKDYEIHKAIVRLRNRIHRIIYMFESELKSSQTNQARKEVKDYDKDKDR